MIISYPCKALEMYIQFERAVREVEKDHGHSSREWSRAFDRYCGFMEGLKCFLDSTQRGCIIMEGDSIIESGEGCLPRLEMDIK